MQSWRCMRKSSVFPSFRTGDLAADHEEGTPHSVLSTPPPHQKGNNCGSCVILNVLVWCMANAFRFEAVFPQTFELFTGTRPTGEQRSFQCLVVAPPESRNSHDVALGTTPNYQLPSSRATGMDVRGKPLETLWIII